MIDPHDPVVQRIRSEFAEMPGLSLTERQAARMWQLRLDEAEATLRALVEAHFLTRSGSGRYCRTSPV